MESNKDIGYINRIEAGYAVTAKCVGCGTCHDMCPTGAMHIDRRPSFIDQEVCIKCGECLEACGHGAIVRIG